MAAWGSSRWARMFGRAARWQLELSDYQLSFAAEDKVQTFHIEECRSRQVDHGFVWSSIMFKTANGSTAKLDGMRRRDFHELESKLTAALVEFDRLNGIAATFSRDSRTVSAWWTEVLAESRKLSHRWFPLDVLRSWEERRPVLDPGFLAVYDEPRLAEFLKSQPAALHDAIRVWRQNDLPAQVAKRNEEFLASERLALADFFNTIEKSPLTDEQVDAVVRFDNRVRVIAAAGSGKTSTMVARAAYTLRRQIASAEEILMLAFNKEAALEIGDRVKARVGTAASGISASTFHAFGMRVIGEATNKKPRLSAGLEQDNGHRKVQEIVDRLREINPQFRRAWDLFRLVFARDLPEFGEEEDRPDWDSATKRRGFRTFNGELVRSQEELLLANWLFYNGVNYEYERPYPEDTTDSAHGQYHPDFYYPDIDAYHEHWAINEDGHAPPIFRGYEDGMRWKKQKHRTAGTILLETTSATVRDGSAFDYLTEEFLKRGIVFDENPYREVQGDEPLEDRHLVAFVRTFMVHAKGNRLSIDDLDKRARRLFRTSIRTRLFLQIYGSVVAKWQSALEDAHEIDFEDMINQATDLIEAGHWVSPYKVIMVDEMQDSSNARARLVRALLRPAGTYLYAVGDDWQSINRFAGADLAVMTNFREWFGEGPTVRLQRTFRSSQSICDVAGTFVMQNPDQLPKEVHSSQPEHDPTIRAVTVRSKGQYESVIVQKLEELDKELSSESPRKASVYILGRYKKIGVELDEILHTVWENLHVKFSTIHGSKGKEADYVIIAELTAGGFPSAIEDDPLLSLAMPHSDSFHFAEERRLFYVALTRARRAVLMLTITGRESRFLLELVKRGEVAIESADGHNATPKICPQCGVNTLVRRTGKFGDFYSCSAFPRCRGTVQIHSPGDKRPKRQPTRYPRNNGRTSK